MSPAARLYVAAATLGIGALAIASLALVRIVPAWGVLFFYVLPTVFFALWGARELSPGSWRRATAPVRRAWRLSRFAPPPARRHEHVLLPEPERAFGVAARGWLLLLRWPLRIVRGRRTRHVVELVFVVAATALVVLVVQRLRSRGWGLHRADPRLTAAAAALFIATFALRALAWQRLFRPYERPRSLALVTSNATAAVAAIALPSRIDDAIAIAVLRKVGRRAPSVGTLALSLFLLGLLDMAALTPFAAFAAGFVRASYAVRVPMLALTGVGVGAALLTAALPSIRGSGRIARYRLGRWLAAHAPASYREAVWAVLLVAGSWVTRAGGLYMLLDAVGLRSSFAVATAYVVAAAGASALPIGPAGAATQAGVGAAVLAGAGIDAEPAIALAVAAQALTAVVAVALALFGVAVTSHARRKARP
ncbi:MAG TPA: lysylphosphatidylglycerol synthase domain-containing protein [Gaiellaceae bacterium]|nr:lysylphosphatidylglycerol synthase domain-containing protein [Gaiellaceae bacterium]